MKRMLCLCLTVAMLCLSSCQTQTDYVPSGDFYVKTSPSQGDGGASAVISLEATYKSYTGDGDITVPMKVGFGHVPLSYDPPADAKDTFYAVYRVIESPRQTEKEAVWEKKVEYAESWDLSKYNSTEQVDRSFLIFPHYGEFYPKYFETVDLVFPVAVEKGYVEVSLFYVSETGDEWQFCGLEFYFERMDGVLTLDPHNK
ncbi:MAG: hypothetical protein IJA91_03185 [Clostridia bacterium]|nr:hypothetical protein [Clostridia bacterium]